MLEKIDLSKETAKEEYKKIITELELRVGALQRDAKELKIPVCIVFEGWDGAGKGTLINKLILPLDPRGFKVYLTHTAQSEEEIMRPFLWRYWNKTPERGRISVFDRSWYRRVLEDRVNKSVKQNQLEQAYNEINHFERQLTDDGNVIIKFFLHISRKKQGKRLKEMSKDKVMSWRIITEKEWKHHKQYDKYFDAYEKMLENTDTDYAPWTIVEAHDRRFAEIKIFKTVIEALEKKIAEVKNAQKNNNKKKEVVSSKAAAVGTSTLDKVDLSKKYSHDEYQKKIGALQEKMREIEFKMYKKRAPLVVMYEGWDGAGKGGNIKRLVQLMDPRGYEVHPVAAPNDIERAHHYLWRFWRDIPKAGHIGIFDRSWYGRVLVERVEGFCKEHEWKRAFKEINEFEEQLVNFGVVVVKFWMHINKEEQMRRFKERQEISYKQWKITDEDWRNREKWDAYKVAVDEMLFRTSTTYAPWTIVEANSKYYARIKVLKTIIKAMEEKL
ncbi:MAG TPA: polyphosphate:AMP phosphotransferase [Bacteroidia bacterium]